MGFGDMIRTALRLPLNTTDAEVLGRAAEVVRLAEGGPEPEGTTVAFDYAAHRCALPLPEMIPQDMTPHFCCPLCHRHFDFDGQRRVWQAAGQRLRFIRGDG